MRRPSLLWPLLVTVLAVVTVLFVIGWGRSLAWGLVLLLCIVWPATAVLDAWAWWRARVEADERIANTERRVAGLRGWGTAVDG